MTTGHTVWSLVIFQLFICSLCTNLNSWSWSCTLDISIWVTLYVCVVAVTAEILQSHLSIGNNEYLHETTLHQWCHSGSQLSRFLVLLCKYIFFFLLATTYLYMCAHLPFLPRNAMHKRGLCHHAVSVCPSVRLLHLWIMSKRINISSKLFHRRVATPF